MSHCKYHPLTKAQFTCPHCDIDSCQQCSHESSELGSDSVCCFICKQPLHSLLGSEEMPPFWRQLNNAFRYPLNQHSIAVIVLSSLLSLSLYFMPLLAIFSLIIITKYSFECLEATAHGKQQAPDINRAYGGNILFIKLLAVILVAIFAVYYSAIYLGFGLALAVGIFALLALPACAMVLAIDDDLSEAINPLKLLQVIASIGLPYGLLLLIIMIMSSSVELINYMIGNDFSVINLLLQSMVSNYYLIVIFHLFGLVVFQYQEALGFYTEQPLKQTAKRLPANITLAEIEVLVKQGLYQQALTRFQKATSSNPQHYELVEGYFRLLIALEEKQRLGQFSDSYIQLLLDHGRQYQVGSALAQIQAIIPEYRPNKPQLRIEIAQLLYDKGAFKDAVFQLNGFHQEYKNSPLIAQAYTLMAKNLLQIPSMKSQASKYIQFANKYIVNST
ncbi:hypothetical protein SIN8267_02760 [Sinobacterium norvegicum]|uniref:Tetratricopeptide repeat protein n=1 Tax=Sinobacterium norvegicum TaxID=1641715 RepID=A0ABM9AHD2_9GAMM|nr:tetratricopeptide repeat protein [Sinobacterium norvegicum]CAH0992627.1 hypothetical protein SIN8267_02760 [Sinobacterium norvegicum]